MIIALTFGTLVHAPTLKKEKRASHPLHNAAEVSNSFLDQTKGDGLVHELKVLKESMDQKKERTKKRIWGWIWLTFSIALCIIDPLLLIWLPPLIAFSVLITINPLQSIALAPVFYGAMITSALFVYPACILFTFYAFCKGCTLLAQGYSRRRRCRIKVYDVSIV